MIELNELIERWTNAERVLALMPEHERLNHWDMSKWGIKTKCGTVACAAGHCGLDPWFRERGFRLDFNGTTEGDISDVPGFFGIEGTARIFHNSKRRSVETVLSEIGGFVSEQRRMLALLESRTLPKIGDEWPEQGGIFAGVRLGINAPDYYLIVGPARDGFGDWSTCMDWAGSLSVGTSSDYALPNSGDGYACFDRVRHLFEPSCYWLDAQHAEDSYDAWYQNFGHGYQGWVSETSKFRARSVRRVPIQ